MERMTNKAWRNFDPWECCGQDNYCKRGCHDEGGCNSGCIVPKLYKKLAIYEDAEEQKQIIVLPCKVGDYVYYHFQFSDKRILPFTRNAKVVSIKALSNSMNLTIEVELMDSQEKGVRKYFHISDFGKTVFLTREEAEVALKGGTDNA